MGPALVLLSAACFGAMAVFGKLAFASGVSPDALVLVRFTAAALLLGAVLLLRPDLRSQQGRARTLHPRRSVLVALGLGAFGYAVQASLYFAALQRLDAPLVALVLYTFPVLVTVGAALLGRERLTVVRGVALVTASLGVALVLVGAGGMGFDTVGVLLAASAAVTYTVYILVADTVLDRLPPVPLTALVMTGAAMALGLRSVLTGGVDLSFAGSGWFWVACIVVVSTVLAVLAFFAGLRRTGASTTSILSTFEPVVSTVLAAVVLGQVLAPVQAIGALLVLGAAVIVHLRPSSTPTVDAPAAQSPSCAQADAPRARAATGDQWDGDGPGRFARRG